MFEFLKDKADLDIGRLAEPNSLGKIFVTSVLLALLFFSLARENMQGRGRSLPHG